MCVPSPNNSLYYRYTIYLQLSKKSTGGAYGGSGPVENSLKTFYKEFKKVCLFVLRQAVKNWHDYSMFEVNNGEGNEHVF